MCSHRVQPQEICSTSSSSRNRRDQNQTHNLLLAVRRQRRPLHCTALFILKRQQLSVQCLPSQGVLQVFNLASPPPVISLFILCNGAISQKAIVCEDLVRVKQNNCVRSSLKKYSKYKFEDLTECTFSSFPPSSS